MNSESLTLYLADAAATEQLGVWLGERLRAGQVLALVGDLGAGKTTLVRGLARGLQIEDPTAVASPTYLLVMEHDGPLPLLHADAYLPAKLAGFLSEGGLDYLLDRRAVVAVEWADRLPEFLPGDALWLELAAATRSGRTARFPLSALGDYPWLREAANIFPAG